MVLRVSVFWIVTMCSDVAGYLRLEAARFSKMLVSSLHDITTQKTTNRILIKTSSHASRDSFLGQTAS